MSGPGVGYEYPSTEVSWLKRDVLLFAVSIGCTVDELHFIYELHPKFAVFPTYSIILPFKKTTQEVIDFYAAQASNPIPGVYDKGKPGTVVETEQTIVDKDTGEVYTRAVGSGFFVGQGGWGGPKGPSTINYPPPKGREGSPDKVSE